MSELSHLSLFSGIGGIDLAAEWAGFRSVGQVERDPYCRQVLQKNFQNTHIWNDIHDLTIDTYRDHCGEQSPALLSGGFPCQPFSVAGQQKSTSDERHLWPEMLRVVQELRPTWVLGENVPGIIPLALDKILTDLEGADYSCRAIIVPACGVGALHKRERVFIVANTNGIPRSQENKETVTIRTERNARKSVNWSCRRKNLSIWLSECGMDRVVNGFPSRVDRLRALGNAVVPQQVYPILQGIADIEYKTSTGGM